MKEEDSQTNRSESAERKEGTSQQENSTLQSEVDNRKKKRKRSRSSSSSSTSSSSSSSSSSLCTSHSESSSDEKRRKKKLKKKEKKHRKKEKHKMKKEKKKRRKLVKQERKLKKLSKKLKKISNERRKSLVENELPQKEYKGEESCKKDEEEDPLSNDLLEASKARAPMTKEEWEKQQSIIRRVYDPETGRHRLIKGSGEILEECVSRDRHKAINRAATRGDGEYFQKTLISKAKNP